jgi:hypothetical protein
MNILVKNITINEVKKVALLLGRNFSKIEKEQKEKGKNIKTDDELLAEMKADTDKKVNDKKSKKKLDQI